MASDMFPLSSYYPCNLLLLLLLFTSFGVQAKDNEVIWSDEEQFVRLAAQDQGLSKQRYKVQTGITITANDHPSAVSTETLFKALQHILVEDMQSSRFLIAGKNQIVSAPLLGSTAAQRFAKALQQAFKQATAKEDIIFRIHGNKQTLGGVLTTTTVNTGRAFWQDNKLHIIFATVNQRHSARWLYGHKVADKKVHSFASRQQIFENFTVKFTALSGIQQAQDSQGKKRPDWLIIDPSQLESDLQAVTKRQALEQVTANSADSQPSRSDALAVNTQASIKQQLSELKNLYDLGLISEILYNAKTKDIIDSYY